MNRVLKKMLGYWRLILGGVLVAAAAVVMLVIYLPEKDDFETQRDTILSQIQMLQLTNLNNSQYADIQDLLPDAVQELEDSRLALYESFPSEFRQEDQLIFLQELEEQFNGGESGALGFSAELYEQFAEQLGVRISFTFGDAIPILALSDGAYLMGQTVTVYFSGAYGNAKSMIEYLSTNERLTSIQYSSMNYDAETGELTGTFTLLCYVMNSDLLEYQSPDVDAPETGKDNIFG